MHHVIPVFVDKKQACREINAITVFIWSQFKDRNIIGFFFAGEKVKRRPSARKDCTTALDYGILASAGFPGCAHRGMPLFGLANA
jgi:hypothetical protein